MTGKKRSKEYCSKVSQRNMGNKYALGHKKSKESIERSRNANLGRKFSEETKSKMSLVRSGKKHRIVTCPYCGKSGGAPAMGQWHFKNCKLKPGG